MLDATRIIEPESPRYRADLVLLHGLWTGPGLWEAAAAGLAHRGWRCWLLDERAHIGEGMRDPSLQGWRGRVEAAIAEMESPPVVVGHDAGGLVALALAEAGRVRAAVAVAPLLEGPAAFVGVVARLGARWLGLAIQPPDALISAAERLPTRARASLLANLSVEAGPLVASLEGRALRPGAPRVPAALVAQADDEIVPRHVIEITARGIEADFLHWPGGHWALAGDQADAWAGALHRWIVRRSGSDILLLDGAEDLREE